MKKQSGFVYLLVLLAAIAVAFFASTMLNLNQNFRQQVVHLAHKDVSFEYAYSVLSGIMAKVYKSGWQNRFFYPKPFQAFSLPVNLGKYDYYVEDSPGKDHQMDVYIQINLSEKTQLYFWRVKFHDEIFDFSNNFSTVHFDSYNADKFPPSNGNKTLSDEVDEILFLRALNSDKAREAIATLADENDAVKIAMSIGAPSPKLSDNVSKTDFDPMKPKGSLSQISVIPDEQKLTEPLSLPVIMVNQPVSDNALTPSSNDSILPAPESDSPFPGPPATISGDPPTILPPRPETPTSILPEPGNPDPVVENFPGQNPQGQITPLPPGILPQ
ncbi:MAG: hypothetical protein ACOYXC_14745 [Candidatus Rifleibacteriota bacterium]